MLFPVWVFVPFRNTEADNRYKWFAKDMKEGNKQGVDGFSKTVTVRMDKMIPQS